MRKKILSLEEKKILLKRISEILEAKECVLFAYVFGSFVSADSFRDIDIAIYADTNNLKRYPLEFELSTESELRDALHIPVDVRIINSAPLSFIYNVLKNKIIVADEDSSLRADFEGAIFKNYFDLQHLKREYVSEIINAPV